MRHSILFILAFGIIACSSCNNNGQSASVASNADSKAAKPSKEKRNKEVIKESMEGMMNHNSDVMLKDAADNFTDYGDGGMAPITNKDTLKSMMNMWFAAFPDVKGDNLMYCADGDHVMVYGEWSGSWKGNFMGMKANGKSFKTKDVDIFKLNDNGKITEHRNIQNWSNVMVVQLGMKMPDMKDKK